MVSDKKNTSVYNKSYFRKNEDKSMVCFRKIDLCFANEGSVSSD